MSTVVRMGIYAALLSTVGCSSNLTTLILTEPPGAFVKVGSTNKGPAPVEHRFDFSEKHQEVVQATLAGYFPVREVVTRQDLNPGEALTIALEADPLWAETIESQATNRWLRIHVNPDFALDDMWTRIVDSISSRYSVIEVLDPVSGYVRSAAETRTFQSRGKMVAARTQIIGTISSNEPLVYKLKIISDSSIAGGPWMPYDRVFKDDAQLIDELQNRLSIR